LIARIKIHLELRKAREEVKYLLFNIFPKQIAEELISNKKVEPRYFKQAHVLFTDFVGFSKIAREIKHDELIGELDNCYRYFDSVIEKYDLEKIKSIGDSYMCVSGVPDSSKADPVKIVNAALKIQEFLKERKDEKRIVSFEARIGIHTGPLIAGIVGFKKLAYDVWGDTVNIAARVQSNTVPGKVGLSDSTWELVKNDFSCKESSHFVLKHTLEEMNVHFVEFNFS
jgi:class 3 adenylate cyclase